MRTLWILAAVTAGLLFASACGGGSGGRTPVIVLDQQNLYDGSAGGQGIGRFSEVDGSPDPSGASWNLQDAQSFTVEETGTLWALQVAVHNLAGGTEPVAVEIVELDGSSHPDELRNLGTALIEVADLPVVDVIGTPEAWAEADLSALSIHVDAGDRLAFIVRTVDTVGYLYPMEHTAGDYASGAGFRRNAALTTTWGTGAIDYGFRLFVRTR